MMQIYACEQLNQHSGSLVFLLGQLLSSIPFLFLISISSGLVFYFLIGLRDEFSLLMYFVLNFFMCLLVNEGLVLALVTIWQDVFWSILTLVCIHVSTWCTMQTFHVELIVELFFIIKLLVVSLSIHLWFLHILMSRLIWCIRIQYHLLI